MSKPAKKKNPLSFYVAMAVVPVILLIALEIILRLVVEDPVTNLVVLREENGQKYYQLNARVGERFFFGGVAAIPEVYPQIFAYTKTSNTLRVFCLGSSTMASFPYELNARISSLLQDRLQVLFPEKNVEVINAGMAAINSYAVCEFIRELVHYQPDLFVMYMGHNEFYGSLGVGSTQSLGQSRWLIRAYLRVQKFRTFQVLRQVVLAAQTVLHEKPQPSPANQTLMEVMAREKTIRLDSEVFRRASQYFQLNLEDILAVAQRHRVPIIVGTLVSNLRDLAPFESGFAPQRTEEEKRRWQQNFENGWRLQRVDSAAAALAFYAQAAAIDTEPAILHYRMAQAQEMLGDTIVARQEYERARDLDLLRFRAPGAFNDIIRESCKKYQVPVVEMEETFARRSLHGIIGREFVSEHLHPNFDGYFLMAKTFGEAIRQSGALMPGEQWTSRVRDGDDDFFREFSAVTEFDLEIGGRKIDRLTSRWPFRLGQFPDDREKISTPPIVRQVVEDYQSNKIAWNTAHFHLAEYYQRQGQFDKAIREYRAVIKIVPDNDSPYARIADLLIQQKKYADAATSLYSAVAVNNASPFLHAKLGLVNFLQYDFNAAAEYFQRAVQINQGRPVLPTNDLASAHYYLALSQIQIGKLQPAQTNLAEVLRYQPQHSEASRLLELLKKGVPVKLQF